MRYNDELLNFDPKDIYDRMLEAGNTWAEAQSTANYLDEVGKVLYASLVKTAVLSMSATQATATAKASPQWQTHIEGLRVAQEVSLKARVKYEAAKGWRDDMRTKIVTLRDVAKIR